jgi:UDP:flavonoid glycosyltransferase YjiC (YdhE family)
MNTVLMIPAPIRSHVLPSFYLAQLLQAQHQVVYATCDGELGQLVMENGYRLEPLNVDRFALGFDPLATYNRHKGKLTLSFFKEAILNGLQRKTFKTRQQALRQLIDKVNPSIVLLDVFSSTDFLILKPLYPHLQFAFFNPMLSTYNHGNMPTVTQGSFEKPLPVRRSLFGHFKYYTSPTRLMAKLTGYDPVWQLNWVYKRYPVLQRYPRAKDNKTIRIFENIPEVILAPLELEFDSSVKRPHQVYAGLSIPKQRTDTLLDESFDIQFKAILAEKQLKKAQLVYVSFGSYFSSGNEYKYIISFCLFLMKAFGNRAEYIFVVSVNERISEAVFKYLDKPDNFQFFKRVRQMQVLEHADAFVTHGGLGSVKEAVHYRVPMLVYPLDMTWDQPGNALKIQHHGIGIKGSFKEDGQAEIREKLTKLLTDTSYRRTIGQLRDVILNQYSCDQTEQDLFGLLERYRH